MLDYQMLRVIWWLILGLVLIGFAVIEGVDFGFGVISRFIGREEPERQALIAAVGRNWHAQQVCLALGGMAAFAAWPLLSAASFSVQHFAVLILLFALISRPLGLGVRNQLSSPRWLYAWDWALCVGGTLPALLCGVAFGNLFLGIPFHIDSLQRIAYTGGVFNLFTPFAMLCGAVSLTMMVLLGACYAAMNSGEPMAQRARHAGICAAGAFVVVFVAAGIGVIFSLEGYRILGHIDPLGVSDPTLKWVCYTASGAWLNNYLRWPLMWLAPLTALLGALFACWLLIVGWCRAAFVASCAVPAGCILTAGFAMFPFLMPSSENPSHSLIVWDASSSAPTLRMLLAALAILLLVVLGYVAWVSQSSRSRTTLARRGRSDSARMTSADSLGRDATGIR